jgi:UDP-2-acetamido-3-amino-2,3-dideoxy-glucuronate N-acetyltransferase
MADYYAHETAYIDDGADIGPGTRIWHFCHIMTGARIGHECTLGQNVFVSSRVTIGNHVKIQNNVSIYEGVILEDYVFCGPSVVFTNVKTPRSAYPRNTSDYLTTRIRYGASIGANATIVCGTEIGRWALIGAGAVVTRDVPANALMVGVPARQIGWACECGEPLRGEGPSYKCEKCERCYATEGEHFHCIQDDPGTV